MPTFVLQNDFLRFGTGRQSSIGPNGKLEQPWYRHTRERGGSDWKKMTYGSYGLDETIKYGA